MNVAFTVTDSYVDYMATTLLSLVETTTTPVTAYVLTSDISTYSRYKLTHLESLYPGLTIRVIVVDETAFEGLPLNRDHISRLEVYFRMAFASLLPDDVERVLYLDSDLLIQQDVTALWETDLAGCYMAGVSEPPSEGAFTYRRSIGMTDPSLYFNSGVLLMDLKKIRQDKIQGLLFETGERIKDKILLQDQDIINVALEGNIKPLDITYNYGYMERQAGLLEESEVAILHYSLEKPWADHQDVWDYNRSAVDRYRRMQMRYRRLIEPLVTILVTIDSVGVDLAKTLQTLKEQTYQHLDIILLDRTGDAEMRQMAWKLVMSVKNTRYYRLKPEEDSFISGTSLALGEYVSLVVAGDELDRQYVAELYLALQQTQAQASVTSPSFLESQTGVYRFYNALFDQGTVVNGRELFEAAYHQPPELHTHYMANRGLLWDKAVLTQKILGLPLLSSQLLKGLIGQHIQVAQAAEKLYLVVKNS